jgi:phosphatidylinositol phospholipase C beta
VLVQVVLPDLASIRIAAYEESGRFIGHRVLPVVGLCPGYRHVNLRTEIGQPLPLATIFVQIVVKDYVPDGLSDFAEALANPIKYQSDLEKRAQQLAVLTDDMEPAEGDDQKKNSLTKATKEHATNGSPIQRPLIATGATSVDMTFRQRRTGDSDERGGDESRPRGQLAGQDRRGERGEIRGARSRTRR